MTDTYIIRCVSDEKSTYLPKINLRSQNFNKKKTNEKVQKKKENNKINL